MSDDCYCRGDFLCPSCSAAIERDAARCSPITPRCIGSERGGPCNCSDPESWML